MSLRPTRHTRLPSASHRTRRTAVALVTCGVLATACRPASARGVDGPPLRIDAGWSAIDAEVQRTSQASGVPMALTVWAPDGRVLHTTSAQGFRTDTSYPVASASKFVAAQVVFAVMTRHPAQLTLDSTTGNVLGWTGPQGAITLRQLLSFTSGLKSSNPCTSLPWITLSTCVDRIRVAGFGSDGNGAFSPGAQFDYGPTHLAVAAHMAEVVSGQSWNDLYRSAVADPLGIAGDSHYFTAPRSQTGLRNPNAAGGLRISAQDYGNVLAMAARGGTTADGRRIVRPELLADQTVGWFPRARIVNSPVARVLPDSGFTYGLGAWRECRDPAGACATIASPGLWGTTPWIDRSHGYQAVLSMQTSAGLAGDRATSLSVHLEQRLQPAIAGALR